ncbi:VOC family protein [soil metagenome]
MERVLGIGGVFFKARDPKALTAWYAANLGLPVAEYGGATFDGEGQTVWSPFAADSTHFPNALMINFRVKDLRAMLAQLRAAGVAVEDKIDEGEYGAFGWFTDPEGNRVELWQLPAA